MVLTQQGSVWQYYKWLGEAFATVELFNVQLLQTDPVDCVLIVLPTFLSDQSQNEMYIFGYNIPLSFT